MAKPYQTALFIFRRDLRLHDNGGLRHAFELAERVLPCFIFDPRQQSGNNDYFTAHGFQFLIESLAELKQQLSDAGGRLYRFYGLPHEVLECLIETLAVEAVFVNRDYTPFSRQRDGKIQAACARRRVFFGQYPDPLLGEPGRVMTDAGAPFVIFTPYHRRASQADVPPPQRLSAGDFFRGNIEIAGDKRLDTKLLDTRNENPHVRGGRSQGLAILKRLGGFKDYDRLHDNVGVDGTTGLSAHHKFGTVSVREVFHGIQQKLGGAGAAIVRQLYWRDFFTQLAFFNPRVFGCALKRKFDALDWDDDEGYFKAWCAGRTGCPIVDAGMRQLNESGWRHNRARLIVSSFLTKDLHIDWRLGERYFARQLVDYDPCVNNGNWQWAASIGADTRPIRIFNPWTQQQKYDAQAEYIKRRVPELRKLNAQAIHQLYEMRPSDLHAYPEPVVDHHREFHAARYRYEQVRSAQSRAIQQGDRPSACNTCE